MYGSSEAKKDLNKCILNMFEANSPFWMVQLKGLMLQATIACWLCLVDGFSKRQATVIEKDSNQTDSYTRYPLCMLLQEITASSIRETFK